MRKFLYNNWEFLIKKWPDQGLEDDKLLVGFGDNFWHETGITSGRESCFRVLCDNLFSLPILNIQHGNILATQTQFHGTSS